MRPKAYPLIITPIHGTITYSTNNGTPLSPPPTFTTPPK
jgi:hypothetical protein